MSASIAEVRARLNAAAEKYSEAMGHVQAAYHVIEEGQGMLLAAGEGSTQADVSEAAGYGAHAGQSVTEAQQAVQQTVQTIESIIARL